MKVSNRKCIRNLSIKSMRAARNRNAIAIIAIALTTILFTSLFTIAISFNDSFEQSNFRRVGGYAHGDFKYLNEEQLNKLKTDPLIKEYGLRRHVGSPLEAPFDKSYLEISYCDTNAAKMMFTTPKTGRLPQTGTNEAVTDTRVLALLGIKPEIGAELEMTFYVDGVPTTETFALCGWWEYDGAAPAHHMIISDSCAEGIFTKLDTKGIDGMTGTWNLEVMFASSMQIERNLQSVLGNFGYQDKDQGEPDYIATGVNWGYTASQVNNSITPGMVLAIAALLLIIIFTGYLIIYNVFFISVAGDIRHYGLLKTIGTTARQIRRMVHIQAFRLSVVGIPIGLIVGYVLGVLLTPVIFARLNSVNVDDISANPLIFIFSALFSLATVLISCRKPGNTAASVTPIEAVRYTEAATGKREIRKAAGSKRKIRRATESKLKIRKVTESKSKTCKAIESKRNTRSAPENKRKTRKATSGASLPKMALANFGRSKKKTVITVVSLSLAVVLLNVTMTFTNGFDMDKYLAKMVSDFIVADAGYFNVLTHWDQSRALPGEVIDEISSQDGITGAGCVYGLTMTVQEFVPEDYFRKTWGEDNNEETVNSIVATTERSADDRLALTGQLYGMDEYVLSKLTLYEGDLSKLSDPGGRYIAAVYHTDDYGNMRSDTNWARVGDRVSLRYVEEFEYYDISSGEIFGVIPAKRAYSSRAKEYHDVEYEIAAVVAVPPAISYRYFGHDTFVMDDKTFIRDTGRNEIMLYTFDTTDEAAATIESYMHDYTQNVRAQLSYESKLTYVEEFNAFRSMFLLLGGVLSLIVGFVGVLNFLNAVLTGILARRREFAVLQAVGMTGRQLKGMLIWEGLYYTVGAAVASFLLCLAATPLLSPVLESMFWFLSYRLTISPILFITPVFAALGIILPLLAYRMAAKLSIVERLRQTA